MRARVRTIGAGTGQNHHHRSDVRTRAIDTTPTVMKTRIANCRDAVFVTRISAKDQISSHFPNRTEFPIRTYILSLKDPILQNAELCQMRSQGLCMLLINTFMALHTPYTRRGLAVNIVLSPLFFFSLYENVYLVTLTIPFNQRY